MRALLHVLGAMAAALVIAAAALFLLGDRTLMAASPEQVGEEFVKALVTRRYERALPYLGGELRERSSAETLRRYAARAPWGAMEIPDVQGERGPVAGDTAVALVSVESEGRIVHTRFILAWSDERVWQIVRLDGSAE